MKKMVFTLLVLVLLLGVLNPIFADNDIKEILNPRSIDVLINKENCLPSDYIPPDLTTPNIPARTYTSENAKLREPAARALENLYVAAKAEGFYFFSASGYRSYALQESVFNSEVSRVGFEKASTQVAYPGTSEHQSGLAMDISSDAMGGALLESFGDTGVGKWVAENCHKYGFIIRYPKDKVHITKYDYEPWHLRYLGVDFATHLYEKDLCMEEYYALNAKYRTFPIDLDGEDVDLYSYNIDGYSYYKIRDIAELLSGTNSEFDVYWNEDEKRVEITKNVPYSSFQGNFSNQDGFNRKAVLSNMPVYEGADKVEIKGYLIDGSNYYKLRDLSKVLGFGVDWIESTRTIKISTITW